MAEVGVEISTQTSKHADELRDIRLDVVITVCDNAHESCPLFPGSRKVVHIGFDDPPKLATVLAEKGCSIEEQLECYRKVRDEIRAFIEALPDNLL